VDSHCHLEIGLDGTDAWPPDQALGASAAVGVPRVVQVGCELDSARWSVDVAARHEQVVAAVALHPNEAPRLAGQGRFDETWAEVSRLAEDDRVRAVGETGLDHFRTGADGRDAQEHSFRLHVALAKRLGKTLVIHDRDAHADVLRVVDEEGAPERVVMHCFSGDGAFARQCLDRGFWLSFAGTVTFRNAEPLREALRVTPVDRLLVETDAPFLTPTPYRGRPNASYLVPVTVRAMAENRGEELARLCRTLEHNTFEAFGGPW
jgi:TatD DNase family protein